MFTRLFLSFLCLVGFLNHGVSQTDNRVSFTDCFLDDCSSLESDTTIQFGFLETLEDYNDPESRKIKIAFAVLKSTSEGQHADPVLYLSGGPGAKVLEYVSSWKDHFLRTERDIILTDFRGIGYSGVSMCDDLSRDYFDVVARDYSPMKEQEAKMKVVFDCFDSLRLMDFNFEAYRSAFVVQDLELLRKGLGYEKWNLFGGSYGTRVGQTYVRDAPEGVRSFISDATHPVGIDILGDEVTSYRKSLNELFSLCQRDPDCNDQFSDLEVRFYAVMEELKQDPIVLEDSSFPDGKFYINYQNAHHIFQQFLYNRSFYVAFPWFIKAMEDGDVEAFKNIVTFLKDRFGHVSLVNFLMVMRNDAFANVKKPALSENDPLFQAMAFAESEYQIFHKMDYIFYDSIESFPVKSEVPTLIMAGSLDPISPPEHGKFLHNNFSNSYYMEFAGMGHGVIYSGSCAGQIAKDFINDPTVAPDNECLNELSEQKLVFLPEIYENSSIATMLRRLAYDMDLSLIIPFILIIIVWLIFVVQWIIGRFRKSLLNERERKTRRVIGLTSTLIILLIIGLIWGLYETLAKSELLVLLGLIKQVNYIFFLTPLILTGVLFGAFLLIKNWYFVVNSRSKLFYFVMVLCQLAFIAIVFSYQLWPAIN